MCPWFESLRIHFLIYFISTYFLSISIHELRLDEEKEMSSTADMIMWVQSRNVLNNSVARRPDAEPIMVLSIYYFHS